MNPRVVENYGSAHGIALRVGKDQATTEDLRTAMIHYRSLFDELVQVPTPVERKRGGVMAELKIKDDELTTAQLATFGILPQEPHRPKLVKSLDEPSNLEGSGNAEKKIEVQKWIGNAEKAVGE